MTCIDVLTKTMCCYKAAAAVPVEAKSLRKEKS